MKLAGGTKFTFPSLHIELFKFRPSRIPKLAREVDKPVLQVKGKGYYRTWELRGPLR